MLELHSKLYLALLDHIPRIQTKLKWIEVDCLVSLKLVFFRMYIYILFTFINLVSKNHFPCF